MRYTVVDGDLLDQPVDAIVNAWNRNIIPWWLLLPQGVSGAIKRRAGLAPFHELGRKGPMRLGSAVVTTAGKLPYRCIIHVAGINMWWCASRQSITDSVRNAVIRAEEQHIRSLALPVIGAGSGSFKHGKAEALICETLDAIESEVEAVLVRYRREAR